MGQGAMENIQTIVITGIFLIAFIALLYSLIFAKSQNTNISMKGAQVALSERILASGCMYLNDAKGISESHIFDKLFLDKNNGSAIPCLDLTGSFYFVKIEAGSGMVWYLNNTKITPYIFNTALRGVTPGCSGDYGERTITSLIKHSSDGFDYAVGRNIIERYGTIPDGEKSYAAKISLVIDADSGAKSTIYPGGYPLCICDIPCPYESCACAKGCVNAGATLGASCDYG